MTKSALLPSGPSDPLAVSLRWGYVLSVSLVWSVFLILSLRFPHLARGTFQSGALLVGFLLLLSAAAQGCACLRSRRVGSPAATLQRACRALWIPLIFAAIFLFFPLFRWKALPLLALLALGEAGSLVLLTRGIEFFYRRQPTPEKDAAAAPPERESARKESSLDLSPRAVSSKTPSGVPVREAAAEVATLRFDAVEDGFSADGLTAEDEAEASDVERPETERFSTLSDVPPRTEFLPGLFSEPADAETIKIPVGSFETGEDAGDEDAELDDDSEEIEPDASQLFFENRSRIDGGRERVEGWFRPRFEPHQEVCVVHLTFSPPFASVPELELFQLVGDEVTLTAGRIEPFGARIEIKRRAPNRALNDAVVLSEFPDESVRIGFFAAGKAAEPR